MSFGASGICMPTIPACYIFGFRVMRMIKEMM